tara:strand:- start:1601 stop:2035 length:435 start_codon:yes stop_codon:yes gene_type:complete
MTSNLGAADAESKKIGFGDQTKTSAVDKAVEKFFTPEFRNRIDSVVQFGKLDKSLMVKIVDRLIKETNELLDENDKSVTVLLDDMARTELADQGYEPAMGARPLKRVFENKIKKPLSKKLLFEDISNTSIMITWNGSEFDFNVQ